MLAGNAVNGCSNSPQLLRCLMRRRLVLLHDLPTATGERSHCSMRFRLTKSPFRFAPAAAKCCSKGRRPQQTSEAMAHGAGGRDRRGLSHTTAPLTGEHPRTDRRQSAREGAKLYLPRRETPSLPPQAHQEGAAMTRGRFGGSERTACSLTTASNAALSARDSPSGQLKRKRVDRPANVAGGLRAGRPWRKQLLYPLTPTPDA